MLKQSKQHANLRPGWQGHAPDYTLYGAMHRSLDTLRLTPDICAIQQRNARTIQRLQTALQTRRQHLSK